MIYSQTASYLYVLICFACCCCFRFFAAFLANPRMARDINKTPAYICGKKVYQKVNNSNQTSHQHQQQQQQ